MPIPEGVPGLEGTGLLGEGKRAFARFPDRFRESLPTRYRAHSCVGGARDSVRLSMLYSRAGVPSSRWGAPGSQPVAHMRPHAA
eukprot:4730965-Prymnesium_polylepis.1